MASRGKSINLFLMDGEPNGRIKCTLANWTGIAYKIPRTSLDLCKERNDLKQSGVYFLFGTSDQTGNNIVYIGQAGARKNGEGLLYRLQEHKRNPDKDYWTEAVVFTTSNNSFGPTEISYLENRFCGLALAAKRYEVNNGNDPTQGNITEEKESELEEFVDYARIVMGTLGHRVFEPLVAVSPVSIAGDYPVVEEPLLYFENTNAKATGRRTSEGFVVLKGSILSQKIAKSCPEVAIKARKKYSDKIDASNTLTEDVLLSSPSAAAAFVGGSSLSGNEMWRTKEGIPLKNLEKTSD
jgi:hypothetical protein